MKTQKDTVSFSSKTTFTFMERIKILFGAKFCIEVHTPVKYDMKRGIGAYPSSITQSVVFSMSKKPKFGEIMR